MATQVAFQDYVEKLNRGIHDWSTHTFKVMLTNVAPNAATHTVKADITEISAGNGYTAGGTATTITSSETGGVNTNAGTQVVFTASGGAMATFRYAVLYNDSATNDNLVSYIDYGAGLTLASGESLTVKFNATTPGTINTLS